MAIVLNPTDIRRAIKTEAKTSPKYGNCWIVATLQEFCPLRARPLSVRIPYNHQKDIDANHIHAAQMLLDRMAALGDKDAANARIVAGAWAKGLYFTILPVART